MAQAGPPSKGPHMFHGLSTVTLYAPDLDDASRWYTEALGIEPYYVTPAYIEFHIGPMQAELGFIKAAYAGSALARTPAPVVGSPSGVVANWHVDDVAAERERLIALGATPHDDVVERGEGAGYVTASVIDPFGNVLGLIHNPHWAALHAGHSS